MSTTQENTGCINGITVPITVSPSTLSGYTRLTEFTFTPNITGDFAQYFSSKLSTTRVVWDFGDGSTVSGANLITPTHTYNYPGNYTINAYFYNENGEALFNTLTRTLSIYNYKTTNCTLGLNSDKFSIPSSSLDSKNNKIDIAVRTTWQDYNPSGNTVYVAASGSKSKPYDSTYKYAFLLPFRSFYTLYNGKFTRTNALKLFLTPVYCVLSGSNIICSDSNLTINSNTSGAKLLYAEGATEFYYYDDLPGEVKIIAGLDTSKHRLPDFFVNDIVTDVNLSEKTFMESNIYTLDVRIYSSPATQLVFSSSGLKSMQMPVYKRQGDKFQVFCAPGDSDGNILKHYPELYFSNTDFDAGSGYAVKALVATNSALSASTSTYLSSVSTNKYPYNSSLSSTYLSSFAYLNYTPVSAGYTTYLAVSARIGEDNSTNVLSGVYTFYVSPSAAITGLYKLNEDFDYADTLKSYRFQSFLHEYDNLFDGVITPIVGTIGSLPTTYGKTIFEKISNFVLNNNDVDICNLSNLKKFYSLLNEEVEFSTITAPPELQRLFDILSIRYKRLVGDFEKFGESFDTYFSSNSAYGKNIDLNNPITLETYTVTAGVNFVARQRFNDEYILIEPMKVPTSTINTGTTSQYPLSCYNLTSSWGWSLDTTVSGSQLTDIYDFYPYVDNYTNVKKNNLLDFDNRYSTMNTNMSSISSWNQRFSYILINKQIREGLQL